MSQQVQGKVRRVSPELDRFLHDWKTWSTTQMGINLGVYQSHDVLAKLAREKLMNNNHGTVNGNGVKIVSVIVPKQKGRNAQFDFKV